MSFFAEVGLCLGFRRVSSGQMALERFAIIGRRA
jgi:hypothetical protein